MPVRPAQCEEFLTRHVRGREWSRPIPNGSDNRLVPETSWARPRASCVRLSTVAAALASDSALYNRLLFRCLRLSVSKDVELTSHQRDIPRVQARRTF
jgi:hypothetical protein